MNRSSRKTLLADFVQKNKRAGVDSRIIDLCAACARQSLKRNESVDFYEPEPTLDQLRHDKSLTEGQKKKLEKFYSRQLELGIDEEVARICLAYAGNLMLEGAAVLFDSRHFAAKLEYPYRTVNFLSSSQYQSGSGYVTIAIPKRGGGTRRIDAPRSKLKAIQRWILANCVAGVEVHEAAHGFVEGRSIVTNAKQHVGKELVVKMDLRGFFPTITFPRVLGVYLDIGYAYHLALLLTRLTTYDDRLPQGAPTSPALSNLICRNLDKRLAGLSDQLEYTYTRYADDLTFSTCSSEVRPEKIIRIVSQIVADEGFECSPEKTRIQRKGTRQLVTGLVVNEKLSVPREDRRRLRAIIHNSRLKGIESQNRDDCAYFLERLEGQVGFVMGVNEGQGQRLRDQLDALL